MGKSTRATLVALAIIAAPVSAFAQDTTTDTTIDTSGVAVEREDDGFNLGWLGLLGLAGLLGLRRQPTTTVHTTDRTHATPRV